VKKNVQNVDRNMQKIILTVHCFTPKTISGWYWNVALIIFCVIFSPAGPLEPEHVVEIQTESQGGTQLPVRALSFSADDSILLAYSGDTFLQPAFEKLVWYCFMFSLLFYSIISVSWTLLIGHLSK